MPIYRPSELRQYLSELGVSPKKRLSQNFLLDGNIIAKIVDLADTNEDDTVIEVGPGPGALTEALLQTGAKIIAVEKDAVLAKGLARLSSDKSRLDIHCEDILDFSLEAHLSSSERKAKVIANLPYHLTTPIMSRLIPKSDHLSVIVVMVQEEVARRFVAKPGTKDYSSFTVFLNFYSIPQYGFKVSRNCFYPRPKVDSAVVRLVVRPAPQEVDPEDFFRFTRAAFAQRRKMLSSTLGKIYTPGRIQTSLEEMGLSSKCRPEELSLRQFMELYQKITGNGQHGSI